MGNPNLVAHGQTAVRFCRHPRPTHCRNHQGVPVYGRGWNMSTDGYAASAEDTAWTAASVSVHCHPARIRNCWQCSMEADCAAARATDQGGRDSGPTALWTDGFVCI